MPVYGYCRVSTGKQVEGESLDVQQTRIKGYAAMAGLPGIDAFFIEEGVSGSTHLKDRPKGGALLSILKPGDAVITAKLDRMFRSAYDALGVSEDFQKRNVSLHMLDLGGDVLQNGMAKMFFTIVAAFAEAERDRIRQRISEVKADQKGRNRFLGGTVPFGYRVRWDHDSNGKRLGGTLEPDPDKYPALEKLLIMAASNDSFHHIAKTLTAEGFPISHTGVKRIILRNQTQAQE